MYIYTHTHIIHTYVYLALALTTLRAAADARVQECDVHAGVGLFAILLQSDLPLKRWHPQQGGAHSREGRGHTTPPTIVKIFEWNKEGEREREIEPDRVDQCALVCGGVGRRRGRETPNKQASERARKTECGRRDRERHRERERESQRATHPCPGERKMESKPWTTESEKRERERES